MNLVIWPLTFRGIANHNTVPAPSIRWFYSGLVYIEESHTIMSPECNHCIFCFAEYLCFYSYFSCLPIEFLLINNNIIGWTTVKETEERGHVHYLSFWPATCLKRTRKKSITHTWTDSEHLLKLCEQDNLLCCKFTVCQVQGMPREGTFWIFL